MFVCAKGERKRRVFGDTRWRGCEEPRAHAYLQEVAARARNAARHSLELDSSVVSIDWELVCHGVVARPLQISPQDTVQTIHTCGQARTLTLRMILPRPSAFKSYGL